VRALAERTETQARDIWDLDHLLRLTRGAVATFPDDLKKAVPVAMDRVLQMPFDAFKAQVVSYLPVDLHELYDSPDAWDRIRELVIDELMRLGE